MRHQFIEPLESRQLLSITWVNRGKGDNFVMYKGNAAVARQIADAVIADWNKGLPKANVKVRISAADIEPGSKSPNVLGRTHATTVQIDRDAAGKGWYFDHDLTDNSDFTFTHTVFPFYCEGTFKGADFYSVVAHEVGHALGFEDHGPTQFNYFDGLHTIRDPHHANNTHDLMYPALGGTPSRRLISPYDVAHTAVGRSLKAPVAPRSFFTASASSGSAFLSLSWTRAGVRSAMKVYRATRPGVTWQAAGAKLVATVSSSSQTSMVDMTAVPGTTYYYFVVPTDGSTGAYAATATGVRSAGEPVATSPAADTDGIHLNWSVAAGVSQVSVYRSTAAGDTPAAAGATLIARFTPTAANPLPSTWTDPGVRPGTTYHYWLVGSYDMGTGQPTDYTSVVGSATSLNVAAAAVQVFADSTSNHPGLRVSGWTPVPGATSYDIYRSTTDAGTWEASGAMEWQTGIKSPSDIVGDGTVKWGKGYYYWVVANFGNMAGATTYQYPPGRGYIMQTNETSTATASFDKTPIVLTVTPGYDSFLGSSGVDHLNVYRSLTYAGTRQASGAQLIGTIVGDGSNNFGQTLYDFGVPAGTNIYFWAEAVYTIFPDLTITRALPAFGAQRPPTPWLDYQPTGSVQVAKGTGVATIGVTWQPTAGAGGYDIYVAAASGSTATRPGAPTAHLADPSASGYTIDDSTLPGNYYDPTAGPRAGTLYYVWVVATPGAGLAAPVDVGSDRGYLKTFSVTQGLPNGVHIAWTAPTSYYGTMIFRSTSPTASPATGGLTYVGAGGTSDYLDTAATPGVTYYYWIFNNPWNAVGDPVWGTASGYRV